MQIETHSAITVVRLDASYSAFHELVLQEAEESILAALDQALSPHLILDFRDTQYFGSVFFETLFRLWKRVSQANGRFVLCGLKEDCLEILHTACLTNLWQISPDLCEALDSFAAERGFDRVER
jgi:anti-anti-sigma factor